METYRYPLHSTRRLTGQGDIPISPPFHPGGLTGQGDIPISPPFHPEVNRTGRHTDTPSIPPWRLTGQVDIPISPSIPSWRLTGQGDIYTGCLRHTDIPLQSILEVNRTTVVVLCPLSYDVVPSYESYSELLLEVGGKQRHAPRRKSPLQ